METINKTVRLNVEELKSKLLARKIIKPRFRVPLTEEQAADLLMASYMAEVEYRRRDFVAQPSVTDNISQLAKFLTSDSSKFGIMFAGVCGNGKTTLLYALSSVVSYLSRCGAFKNEMLRLPIVRAKEVAGISSNPQSLRELRCSPLLAIDDMGTEPAEIQSYGNILSPIVDLIEYRYNEQLFTVISTNLTPDQIKSTYGKRIADRFNEMLEVIIFKNGTYRK